MLNTEIKMADSNNKEEMNIEKYLNSRVKILKWLNRVIRDFDDNNVEINVGLWDSDGISYEASDEDYMRIAKNEIEFYHTVRLGLIILDYGAISNFVPC